MRSRTVLPDIREAKQGKVKVIMNSAWMKKVLVALGASAALSASANTIKFQTSMYQYGNGGEFSLTPTWSPIPLSLDGYSALTKNINGNGSFQSFCMEYTEHISYGGVYTAVLNDRAISGSTPGGAAGYDVLSVGTAWLYNQFASGSLAGYRFTGTEAQRENSARLLQNAFWVLENEPYTLGGSLIAPIAGNPFITAVEGRFGNFLAAQADVTDATRFGVSVINLTSGNGELRQDQLYWDGTKRVPDGGLTVALLGIAVAGLAALRRRTHNA